jgi:phospholipid/cholesterol/gamma-HCH transport system substrate-binding protein
VPGGAIPLERSLPALDLDTLFAGFDPLMQALDAEEINKLTSNILAVTQGQAGAVEGLLANVASFTSTLAERDELIGDTITNLTSALSTVDDRKEKVDALITGLNDLTRGLARDRRGIGRSLDGVATVASDTARLLRKVRPDLKANIDQLGSVALELNKETDEVIDVLRRYPATIQRLARGGAFGSFFNFFLCSVRVKVTLPNLPPVQGPNVVSDMDRCAQRER